MSVAPRARLAALALSLIAAPSCADDGSGDTEGSSDGTEGSEDTDADSLFDTEVQPVLDTWCLCHMQGPDGSMEAPFLTLNAGMAVGNLVDVPSNQVPTMARVTPGDREQSYLWHKINGTHGAQGGMGDPMPPGFELPPEDVEAIGRWIDMGAMP